MSGDCRKTVEPVEDENLYRGNRWSRFRSHVRQPFAEFLGTLLFVTFGLGGTCQAVLSSLGDVSSGGPKGDYISGCFAWGFSVSLGIWVSGGISGGHLNPAVTLAFAVLRRFSWVKAATYWLSQLLGGLVGAVIVYGNYKEAIDLARNTNFDPTTFLITSPASYVSTSTAFFSEVLCAALFVLAVFALTDRENCALPAAFMPGAFGVAYVGIGVCFGLNTGWTINPVRDLAPRLILSAIGYTDVWSANSHYWLWGPICGSLLGGLIGGFVYDVFCFTGRESIINTMHMIIRPGGHSTATRPDLEGQRADSFDKDAEMGEIIETMAEYIQDIGL